jgi:mannosyl-glycoprotein endo-beta-N-acetylglucosaminidase
MRPKATRRVLAVQQNGVIEYPIISGQPVPDGWQVTQPPDGPRVVAGPNFFRFTAATGTAPSSVAVARLQPRAGCVVTFRVRVVAAGPDEVRLALVDGIVLRITDGGRAAAWQRFDGTRYQPLATSDITVGEPGSPWYDVAMVFSGNTVTLLENGRYRFSQEVPGGATVRPVFAVSSPTAGADLALDIGAFLVAPPTYNEGLSTPWDYAFATNRVPPAEEIVASAPPGGPQIGYGPGYARFSVTPASDAGTEASLTVRQTAPAVSVQAYRIRTNRFPGDETRIAFPGGQFLRRIGSRVTWERQLPDGTFEWQADSRLAPGANEYLLVTLVTSASTVTVLEDGVFAYTVEAPMPDDGWRPRVAVRQFGTRGNVQVDLGGFRIVPYIKQSFANQPYSPHWFPADLLEWNPGLDPDDAFNRSRTPLARRVWMGEYRANPAAQAGNGDIMALSVFGNTSRNPSQGGGPDPNYYAFGYWQYVGTLVYWGGSASEGLIVAPTSAVTDAAHRNGVPVLGTVFFPQAPKDGNGGKIEWVEQFVDPCTVRKLIAAARYFGFDGWFINQETDPDNDMPKLAEKMQRLLIDLRDAAPDLLFVWYDAMNRDGRVGWQNELNDRNSMFFEDPTAGQVSSAFFVNFSWGPDQLAGSRRAAEELKRDPFDLYAGVNVGNAGVDDARLAVVFPDDRRRTVSAGLYRPDWSLTTMDIPTLRDFYDRESRFWVGFCGDPSRTCRQGEWRGVSSYLAERTAIAELPFVSSFNTGHGTRYAVAGQIVSTAGWYNLALQDPLPTYRWWVSTPPGGVPLTARLDFDDAYDGGSSLLLTGAFTSESTIRLYQAELPVTPSTQLRIVAKSDPRLGPNSIAVGLRFDGDDGFTYVEASVTGADGWQAILASLRRYAGRVIRVIGLRVAADPTRTAPVRIGQLAVFDGSPGAPAAPTGLRILAQSWISDVSQTLRLAWSSLDPTRLYHVYRRNPDGTFTHLAATTTEVAFVRLDQVGAEATTVLRVTAVGPTMRESPAASITVGWRLGR